MNALLKIKKAGFEISLYGDGFEVYPASKLTMQQREFLKSHKAEIVSELKAANLKAEQATTEIISKFVKCYSPSGLCYEVEARDEEHAAWLKKMNPPPKGKQS
jgi:hypothetical protein